MLENKKEKLDKKLDQVNDLLKKSNLEEMAYLIGDRKQIFLRNFWAGLWRGVGIGIGVTVITATLVAILQRIVALNIPIIGEFVADIINIVEQSKF